MSLALWRSPLQKALHLNRSQPHSRYFQLATITPEGKPTNRTVVFRGFLENSNSLQMITDLRSEKITHLQHNNNAEICWYFTKTREQFRLSGKITVITENCSNSEFLKARQIVWKNISEAAKKQFTWPFPKQPINDNQSFEEIDINLLIEPLDNFCLLLFDPETVDHLQLKGEPQKRCLYQLDHQQNWLIQPVNP